MKSYSEFIIENNTNKHSILASTKNAIKYYLSKNRIKSNTNKIKPKEESDELNNNEFIAGDKVSWISSKTGETNVGLVSKNQEGLEKSMINIKNEEGKIFPIKKDKLTKIKT